MSLVTISRKRNRVYPRKFDHEQALVLHVFEGLSYAEIARRMGVTPRAVARVVDPNVRHEVAEYTRRFLMSGECRACGGPRTLYNRQTTDGYESSRLCRSCWGESRQTRFRFDEMGQLALIRCRGCKSWKDADEFPSARNRARNKHSQCRECGTKARQAHRERQKVPCVGCGKPALPPNEKRTRGSRIARCLECFYADRKQASADRRSREAAQANKEPEQSVSQ